MRVKTKNISRTLKDLLSLTRWPFLSIAVIGSEMAKFKASRFVLSGSVAFNVVKTVPIGVSSVTSARCVSGVKYGALSLLFSTSIISVVVPVRLGVPEMKYESRRNEREFNCNNFSDKFTLNNNFTLNCS